MQINTALFGPQEIQDDEIITFPQGLPGFEENTRFKVFHEEGKPTVHWLQSVDDADLCFSVMEPDLLNLGYEFELSDEQTQILDVTEGDELIVVLMLSKAGNTAEKDHEIVPNLTIRANLQGPLVINLRSRKALQASLPKVERITLIRGIA